MMSFGYLWATGWLLQAVMAAQRFGAMDAYAAPTLSPRYYQAASPLRPLQVGKRQEFAPCQAGQHTCSDIGPLGVGSCCPDDTYCIIDPSGSNKPSCCAIGSLCNSPCSASEYQCVITVTITATVSALPVTTTATQSACCPRQCTQTSMFGCASSLGGGCCSYGQTCASSSQCLWTSIPASAVSSVVSQIPPGCTTSQIGCPSSLGGGCCAVSQSCTLAGTGPACAAITVAPTASGVAAVPQHKDGLATGAKAGIGVGVVVLAGLAVALATYLILRRRRRRSSRRTGPGSTTLSAGSASGPPQQQQPQSPLRRTGLGILSGERLPEMSDSQSPTGLRGLAADYFGPAAVPGPFTEGDAEAGSPASVATTPPGGNNRDRAVPREPHSPDDITAPVEIDSQAKQRDVSETIAGRFELYGTELRSPSSTSLAHSPYDEVVSPYTPSPGAMGEGHMLPSPTLGHQNNRW
ncbi:hypothetical protein GE09DRAFT_1287259 [Coniochaeta sp. 2T2.1]|nr:hypothetical protein GE09DRAFT_1287259 [Coniochaeta sp. 2T2.1]